MKKIEVCLFMQNFDFKRYTVRPKKTVVGFLIIYFVYFVPPLTFPSI